MEVNFALIILVSKLRPPALITDPQNNYAIMQLGFIKIIRAYLMIQIVLSMEVIFIMEFRGSAPLGHNESSFIYHGRSYRIRINIGNLYQSIVKLLILKKKRYP